MTNNQWQGWVKVQRSLHTTAGQPQMLVYNEDRSIELQSDLPGDVADLMGARVRIYLKAGLLTNGQLALDFATVTEVSPW